MVQLLPRLSRSYCSERLVCEPAAFYVRPRNHLDVITDNPDGRLPLLPGKLPAPEVVAIHLFDCPKDSLDYAALVVFGHESIQIVPVRTGHIPP